jgi:hypothetical protein
MAARAAIASAGPGGRVPAPPGSPRDLGKGCVLAGGVTRDEAGTVYGWAGHECGAVRGKAFQAGAVAEVAESDRFHRPRSRALARNADYSLLTERAPESLMAHRLTILASLSCLTQP